VIHKQQAMSHYQLNYVAELLNSGTCFFRPGYLQAWVQLGGGTGEVSVHRVQGEVSVHFSNISFV